MEPPNLPGPGAQRGGSREGGAASIMGFTPPPRIPLGTVGSPVKSPTITHSDVPMVGGGVAPRNPSHWWARGGGPLKSKGGEIKLGLTPSEL